MNRNNSARLILESGVTVDANAFGSPAPDSGSDVTTTQLGTILTRLRNIDQLFHTEFVLLDRLLYKNRSQHRNAKHFMRVSQVKKLLASLHLTDILNMDEKIAERIAKPPKSKTPLQTSPEAAHQLLYLHVAFAQLCEDIADKVMGAHTELAFMLSLSNFMPYVIVMLSLMGRLFALAVRSHKEICSLFGIMRTAWISGLENGSRVCKEWKGLIGPLPENIAQLVFKPQPAKSQPLSKKPDIVSKVVSIGQVSDRLMDQVEKQQAQAIAASEDLGEALDDIPDAEEDDGVPVLSPVRSLLPPLPSAKPAPINTDEEYVLGEPEKEKKKKKRKRPNAEQANTTAAKNAPPAPKKDVLSSMFGSSTPSKPAPPVQTTNAVSQPKAQAKPAVTTAQANKNKQTKPAPTKPTSFSHSNAAVSGSQPKSVSDFMATLLPPKKKKK